MAETPGKEFQGRRFLWAVRRPQRKHKIFISCGLPIKQRNLAIAIRPPIKWKLCGFKERFGPGTWRLLTPTRPLRSAMNFRIDYSQVLLQIGDLLLVPAIDRQPQGNSWRIDGRLGIHIRSIRIPESAAYALSKMLLNSRHRWRREPPNYACAEVGRESGCRDQCKLRPETGTDVWDPDPAFKKYYNS